MLSFLTVGKIVEQVFRRFDFGRPHARAVGARKVDDGIRAIWGGNLAISTRGASDRTAESGAHE